MTQRAFSPERTAAMALPWLCCTPFGAPLLPEVKITAMGSAGRTVAASAATKPSGTPPVSIARTSR